MAVDWGVVAAWSGVGVSLGGFLVLGYQVRLAVRESRLTARAMMSNLYGHVAIAMDRVNSRLLENPDLVPYFHEGAQLPAHGDRTRRRAELVCETILDMADTVVEQRRVRPDDMDWSTWFAYFRWLQDNSPALRTFLDENVDFFPDYIFAVFGRIHVRDRARGNLLHEYYARECEQCDEPVVRRLLGLADDTSMPQRGYPWVRTWLFRAAEDKRETDPLIVAHVDVKDADGEAVIVRLLVTDGELVTDASVTAVREWMLQTFDRTGVRWVEFDRGTPTAFDLARPDLNLYGPRVFAGPSLPTPK